MCLTFLTDRDNGNLTTFWNAYIVMMEVVLGLIWASRERDRMLHLNFKHAMTVWPLGIDAELRTLFNCLLNAQMMHFPDNHIHLKNGGSEWISRHLRKIKWSKRWIKTLRKRQLILKVQYVLLEQRAPKCFWDKWARIQLTYEFTETVLELDQTDAEASLKISENHWLPIRLIFSTCQVAIYFY